MGIESQRNDPGRRRAIAWTSRFSSRSNKTWSPARACGDRLPIATWRVLNSSRTSMPGIDARRQRDCGARSSSSRRDDEPELKQGGEVAARWNDVRFSIGVHPHAAAKYAADPADAARLVHAAIDAQPLTRAARRDRPRLSLRLRAARRAAGGLPRTDPPGAHAPPPDRHPHARGRRRYVPDPRRRSRAGDWRRVPLLHGRSRHGAPGARSRVSHVAGRHRHVPRALELHEVAKLVPLDRLLVETDSPFLAPVPHRGKRNEPAHVVRVAETVAGVAGDRPASGRPTRPLTTLSVSSTRNCNSCTALARHGALTLRARIWSDGRA